MPAQLQISKCTYKYFNWVWGPMKWTGKRTKRDRHIRREENM